MQLPRVRFTVRSMMVAVMMCALVVYWFRPVTQTQAEKIAQRRFLKVPGASRWVGCYGVHAWNNGDVWIVYFTESGDRTHLAQLIVTSKGEIHALGIAAGKFK